MFGATVHVAAALQPPWTSPKNKMASRNDSLENLLTISPHIALCPQRDFV